MIRSGCVDGNGLSVERETGHSVPVWAYAIAGGGNSDRASPSADHPLNSLTSGVLGNVVVLLADGESCRLTNEFLGVPGLDHLPELAVEEA